MYKFKEYDYSVVMWIYCIFIWSLTKSAKEFYGKRIILSTNIVGTIEYPHAKTTYAIYTNVYP